MKCLQSGWCCIHLSVIIIDDDVEPAKGMPFGMSHKTSGVPCKHLEIKEGVASCGIHDDPRYIDSPCDQYTQVGVEGAPCRMGDAIRKGTIEMEIPEVERIGEETDVLLSTAIEATSTVTE